MCDVLGLIDHTLIHSAPDSFLKSLLHGGSTVTGNFNVTAGLATVTFIAIIAAGTIAHGFVQHWVNLVPHGMQTYTASFPSGHSMMAAVTYLTLATIVAGVLPTRALKVYVLALAILVTLAVGISRIYLGVHWPTDVLAGWTAGAAWALAWWLAARWLLPPRETEAAPKSDLQSDGIVR